MMLRTLNQQQTQNQRIPFKGGSVTVKPNQGESANVNTNPKVVINPSTAIITNPDVAVNQNNVDVNVDGNSDADSNNDGNDETN